MNITEKILARASGRERLSPDDVVFVNVDKVMLHDVSGPGVIKVFEKLKNQGINVEKLLSFTIFSAETFSAEGTK